MGRVGGEGGGGWRSAKSSVKGAPRTSPPPVSSAMCMLLFVYFTLIHRHNLVRGHTKGSSNSEVEQYLSG